jgi:hypothetical protein
MTARSHESPEAIHGRVINRLRQRWPRYRWRYCMRRRFDALWPTYEASCSRQRRTVTWFTVGDESAWRWTDSREPALPVGSGAL